ncbi:MAG: wax ester/triacylglycerol synthase domain-containing protein, partial [Actinomycetota bacterium]
MQRLSGMDASFLYTETPTGHMHVTGVIVADATTMAGGYDFERIKDLLRARLHVMPMFRRRIAEVPFSLDHPVWIEDPDFDLDYHIRHIAVPPPGSKEQLADLSARIAARHLDRSHPLWEMYIIEGVEGGGLAVLTKIHHACIDGVAGAEILGL